MKYLKIYEDVVNKNGKSYEVIYKGDNDPTKDGFLIHFTGYDDAIGNRIIGFFDIGPYETAIDSEELKKIMDENKNAITSGFSYCNANDVKDIYSKFIKEMDVSMIPQYRERIEPFGFEIIEK